MVFNKEITVEQEVKELAPESIDCTGPWLFWKEDPGPELADSLTGNGQLLPVLVRDGEHGPELVDGLKRVTFLKRQGRSVLARFVTAEADPGVLYVEVNGVGGGFVGEARAVTAWRYFQDRDVLPGRAAVLLGTSPRSRQWRQILEWGALEPVWDTLLSQGHVALAHAPLLGRMTADDRAALEGVFEKLAWSRNNGQNLLTWLWEMSRSRGTTAARIIQELGLVSLMDQDLSPKDRISRILDTVRQARYPELTGLERDFGARSREVTVGTRWKVRPGDAFETGAVELSVRLKTRQEMDRAVQDLKRMHRDRIWELIWPNGK